MAAMQTSRDLSAMTSTCVWSHLSFHISLILLFPVYCYMYNVHRGHRRRNRRGVGGGGGAGGGGASILTMHT